MNRQIKRITTYIVLFLLTFIHLNIFLYTKPVNAEEDCSKTHNENSHMRIDDEYILIFLSDGTFCAIPIRMNGDSYSYTTSSPHKNYNISELRSYVNGRGIFYADSEEEFRQLFSAFYLYKTIPSLPIICPSYINDMGISGSFLGEPILARTLEEYINCGISVSCKATGDYNYLEYSNSTNSSYALDENQNAAVQQRAAEIAASLTGSNYDRMYQAFNYLAMNVNYDYSLSRYNMYQCLIEGNSVCAGYAASFKLIMDYAGIECYIVSGSNHSWNIVNLDGKYYYVDCTNGSGNRDVNKDEWFLFGTAEGPKTYPYNYSSWGINVEQSRYSSYVPQTAPTEAVTEATTEPPTEAPTEPLTEVPTEPITEATTEPLTEVPTEPITEATTEPLTEAMTEPPAETEEASITPVTEEPSTGLTTYEAATEITEAITESVTPPSTPYEDIKEGSYNVSDLLTPKNILGTVLVLFLITDIVAIILVIRKMQNRN